MANKIENLTALADEFNVRSPARLRKQARLEGVSASMRKAQETLKTDLPKQVFALKPRSLGKSAAEGPDDRLQLDLIDFSANTKKDNPNRVALVGIDVLTREMAVVPMKTMRQEEANEAFRKAAGKLVDGETDYRVTTDQGTELRCLRTQFIGRKPRKIETPSPYWTGNCRV